MLYFKGLGKYDYDETSIDFRKFNKGDLNNLMEQYPLSVKKRVREWKF